MFSSRLNLYQRWITTGQMEGSDEPASTVQRVGN